MFTQATSKFLLANVQQDKRKQAGLKLNRVQQLQHHILKCQIFFKRLTVKKFWVIYII